MKPLALCMAVVLASCAASQPAISSPNLIKTEWQLEDLGGKGVVDWARATLAFPGENQAAGNGSCNRFFGPVEIKGDAIHFGPLVATRMACLAGAVSKQESDYLEALRNAERFSVDGPYLLIYCKGMGKPLRFTRIQLRS